MKYQVSFILICLFSLSVSAQDESKKTSINCNGYLSEIPSLYWDKIDAKWQSVLHNRLNIEWLPSDKISGALQFRNQFFLGNLASYENYETGFKSENYYLPLTYLQKLNNESLLSFSIDRAWVKYTAHKLEIMLGRQRINWGQSFVWSTNDIFNTYNFFEFDYPERPGVDAIRVQYYTGNVSSLDFASKIDSAGNISVAGLVRFNKWTTDIQFLAGYLQESAINYQIDSTIRVIEGSSKDFVTGMGFAGSIKNISIRGEMSYFYSFDNEISPNQFLLSLSSDYSFDNQLQIMFEFFYSDKIISAEAFNFAVINSGSRNVKSQAFTKYNFFGQVAYPINPIINISFSGMYFYNKDIKAFYAGPGLDVSVSNNITISAFLQAFYFNYKNPISQKSDWENANFAFLRAKWNF